MVDKAGDVAYVQIVPEVTDEPDYDAALAALGLVALLPGRPVGALGASILAALAHMGTQLLVAYTLFIPHTALFGLVPPLMTASLIFGTVSGIIAATVVEILASEAETS